MKKLLIIPLILAISLSAACSRGLIKYGTDQIVVTNEKKGEGLTFRGLWIKNKRKTIEVEFTLTNNYKDAVKFEKDSLKLTINEQVGILITELPTLTIEPEKTIKKRVRFDFHPEVSRKGQAVLTIDPILNVSKEAKLPPLVIQLPMQK
jgi:hypothetical protein